LGVRLARQRRQPSQRPAGQHQAEKPCFHRITPCCSLARDQVTQQIRCKNYAEGSLDAALQNYTDDLSLCSSAPAGSA
jgi:hypothetical protein